MCVQLPVAQWPWGLLGGLLLVSWGPSTPGLQPELGSLQPGPDVLADKMEGNGQAARGVRRHPSQADSPP